MLGSDKRQGGWKADIKRAYQENLLLCAILLIQICVLVYMNLFRPQYHLGYDASTYYLQAIESWKQKTLFLNNWAFQTTLAIDSPVGLAALLYGLFHNIYIAYGLSVIVITAVFMLLLNSIALRLGMSVRARLIFFIMLLTPYFLTPNNYNALGYFHVMYFSCGAYLVKVLQMFLIWYVFQRIDEMSEKSWKNRILSVIVVVGCGVCGASGGVSILMLAIAPAVVYMLIRWIATNQWKKTHTRSAIFLAVCSIAALLGNIYLAKVLHFEGKDTQITWISLDKFWENLRALVLGFLNLIGAFPQNENVRVLTVRGIGIAFPACLSALILAGGGYLTAKSIKQSRWETGKFWSMILGISVAIFVPLYTTGGWPFVGERYLVQSFIILLLFASKGFDELLSTRNRAIAFLLSAGFALCVVATNVVSYKNLYRSENQYDSMQELKQIVHSTDAKLVYIDSTNFSGPNDVGMLRRNMRVIDQDVIYKYSEDMKRAHLWGDYTYFNENTEYQGPTMLVCTKVTWEALPEYLKSRYEWVHTLSNTEIGVYYCDDNPMDFASGITASEKNIDFPYTNGICLSEHGTFDEAGAFITDGTGGWAVWGPYCGVPEGTYTFTLNYEVLSAPDGLEDVGTFDVAIDAATVVATNIDREEQKAVLPRVSFSGAAGRLEYRTWVAEGVTIKIKSFEIVKE